MRECALELWLSHTSVTWNDGQGYTCGRTVPASTCSCILNSLRMQLLHGSLLNVDILMCVHSKVKVLFKFTKAGGGRSEDETQKLLQVVGARDEDEPLLKFWMTGLSMQYRTHILASSKQR